MTACIRNLFYMAQDLRNLFWPSQLTLAVRERDYDKVVDRSGMKADPFAGPFTAEEQAALDRASETLRSELVEREAEEEVAEPAKPSLQSLFQAYWDARTPEVETQALDDLDRYYPDWRPSERPDSAALGVAASSPEPPTGDDDPADVPPSVGSTNFDLASLIVEALDDHQLNCARADWAYGCDCGEGFNCLADHQNHVADEIAERIESNCTSVDFTRGDLARAAAYIHAYRGHLAAFGGDNIHPEMRELADRLAAAAQASTTP